MGYDHAILSDLSFRVEKGEITGILGPNGSGKSTLLRTLAANLRPISGVVYLDGDEIYRMRLQNLAKKLSVMLTERIDVGFLTGFEVVALGRYPYTDAFGRLEGYDFDVIEEALKIVNADQLSNKPFSEMSDGERQKILIARALAQEPEIILMDEPTSFLDAKHKIEVMLLLRRIANEKGVAIVLTSHDIELSLRICDKVILVRNGKIFAKGLPEEILTVETLETVYGASSASFETSLGTFELCRENRIANLHIVCGGGTGVNLMRFLAKKGVGFTAGVIHSNDIDFIVARNTASAVIHEKPYREIGKDRIKSALELVEGKVVVDTGFPIGDTNAENLELLRCSSRVLSFRSRDELKRLGLDSIHMRSISDVLKEVK